LRWNSPERGNVPPGEFIPIAEACGAIIAIGGWVVEAACAEAARWSAPLRVAVNVSPAQIQRGDFASVVAAALARAGLDPARLELEVTESLLIHDPVHALLTLRRLKALGISIALDDFGTGYSSLTTLRTFEFDRVKIDRSFIEDLPDNAGSAAIVRAVLGLGRGLGLPVVAEGVETPAQLAALRAEGCAEVQGYLIGRPMPIETHRAFTHPSGEWPAPSPASRKAAATPPPRSSSATPAFASLTMLAPVQPLRAAL
jgi:EAL domain-containing protein (putative c-di-GMP-specific phosphodiesterase class I)